MSSADVTGLETTSRGAERRWFTVTCAKCRYRYSRPGAPLAGDLEQPCQLCGAELGAVTVYAVGGSTGRVALPTRPVVVPPVSLPGHATPSHADGEAMCIAPVGK